MEDETYTTMDGRVHYTTEPGQWVTTNTPQWTPQHQIINQGPPGPPGPPGPQGIQGPSGLLPKDLEVMLKYLTGAQQIILDKLVAIEERVDILQDRISEFTRVNHG